MARPKEVVRVTKNCFLRVPVIGATGIVYDDDKDDGVLWKEEK